MPDDWVGLLKYSKLGHDSQGCAAGLSGCVYMIGPANQRLSDGTYWYAYVENRWIGELIDSNGDGTIDHETGFVYDGSQIVLQFDKDVSEPTAMSVADLSHRYLWLANAVDQLMADEQLQGLSQFSSDENGTVPLGSAGTVVWTLGDQQGTIKDLAVTENGTTSIVTHRVYDSYGNLISSTGTVDCLFGYTGFAWDKGSETYRSQTRPYDPLVGRWIQEDLIGLDGCDTNVNRYCGNSPTNATDPSGEQQTSVLTETEQKFIFFVFLSIWGDSTGIGVQQRQAILARLKSITLNIDPNPVSAVGQGSVLAWFNLNIGHAEGITLGKRIFVKQTPNTAMLEGLTLVCHETLHSIEQSLIPNWFDKYLADYATQLASGSSDPYRGTEAELRAYAFENAVAQVLVQKKYAGIVGKIGSLTYNEIELILKGNNPKDQIYRDFAADLKATFISEYYRLGGLYHVGN